MILVMTATAAFASVVTYLGMRPSRAYIRQLEESNLERGDAICTLEADCDRYRTRLANEKINSDAIGRDLMVARRETMVAQREVERRQAPKTAQQLYDAVLAGISEANAVNATPYTHHNLPL